MRRVRAALPPGGMLLTRVGDALVTTVRGHRLPELYCRPFKDWVELLRSLGFEVETIPMSKGKPFANVMVVVRVPG